MRGRRLRDARLGALILALGLAGCAPVVQSMGPATLDPYIAADQVVTADTALLPLRRWLPDGEPRAVILALHGFNDYSRAFELPAERWREAGIATYAYDQRGFGAAPYRGLWPGTATMVADLEATTRAIAKLHPGAPVFLLGESMGGAVVMAAAAEGRIGPAAGVILVAPAVRSREALGPIASAALWFFAHTIPGLAGHPGNIGIRPSDNIEMLRAYSRDPLVIKDTRIDAGYGLVNLMDDAYAAAARLDVPTLLLYGIKDDLVPPKPTLAMIERLPPAGPERRRVAIYATGYHMLLRDLQARVVHDDVAAWVLSRPGDPLAPLPSGADARGLAALKRD